MRIVMSVAGMVAGAAVGAIAYGAITGAGEAAATVAHYGSTLTGLLVGKGVTVIAGPTTGRLAEAATIAAGQACLAPSIRTGSRTVALAASAAASAATVAGASLLVMGGGYLYQRACQAFTYMQAPNQCEVSLLENDDMGFALVENILKPDDASSSSYSSSTPGTLESVPPTVPEPQAPPPSPLLAAQPTSLNLGSLSLGSLAVGALMMGLEMESVH